MCHSTRSLPYFGVLLTSLRGPTPFEDMIFYLWTDSNKICTAYVKLKINHILFMNFFLILDSVFEKIMIFYVFEGQLNFFFFFFK